MESSNLTKINWMGFSAVAAGEDTTHQMNYLWGNELIYVLRN